MTTHALPLSSSYPLIGQRIRLRRPASLPSDPRGEAGLIGMVLAALSDPGQESISAWMYQPLANNTSNLSLAVDEIWRNCLTWQLGAETVQAFLADCELLPSAFPVAGQRIRLVRDVWRDPYILGRKGATGTLTMVNLLPGAVFIRALMDRPLSDDPEYQAEIEEEFGNHLEWDDPDTVASFFADCVVYPLVGQRIRLRQPVTQFDLFYAPSGRTGVVADLDSTEGEDFVSARMDAPLSDNPELQARIEAQDHNCITWQHQQIPEDGSDEARSALEVFLADCDYVGEQGQVLLSTVPEILPLPPDSRELLNVRPPEDESRDESSASPDKSEKKGGDALTIPGEILQELLDEAYRLAVEVHYNDVPRWDAEKPLLHVLRTIKQDFGWAPAIVCGDPEQLLEGESPTAL